MEQLHPPPWGSNPQTGKERLLTSPLLGGSRERKRGNSFAGRLCSRSQDGDQKGKESSLGKGSDWLGGGPSTRPLGSGRKLANLKDSQLLPKTEIT